MEQIEVIQQRLIEAIKTSGMKQKDIAKGLNITEQTLIKYLTRRTLPALDTFARLCILLEEDPAYLLGVSDLVRY